MIKQTSTTSTTSRDSRDSRDKINMSKYDDDLPPPYTPPPATSTSIPTSSTSFLTAHLDTLRSRAELTRDANENHLVYRITDAVEALLTTVLAKPRRHQQPPLRIIEAVVVPEAVIGSSWILSDADADGKESSKVVQVVRVETEDETKEAGGSGDSKRAPGISQSGPSSSINKGFDDWGRWSDGKDDAEVDSDVASWWRDEDLARHLVRYLQPAQTPARPANAGPSSTATRMNQAVSMTARVDEATFRRENDMGLWESRTGWAIIVRFRI